MHSGYYLQIVQQLTLTGLNNLITMGNQSTSVSEKNILENWSNRIKDNLGKTRGGLGGWLSGLSITLSITGLSTLRLIASSNHTHDRCT